MSLFMERLAASGVIPAGEQFANLYFTTSGIHDGNASYDCKFI